jgi:hypothetical protein
MNGEVSVVVGELTVAAVVSKSQEQVKADQQSPAASDSADGKNRTVQPTPPVQEGEIRIESIETVQEDIKCSLRDISENARVNNNPVTLHRFAVKQMMMNNPHIKFYQIKWCSLVDYCLDWHWWFTRKCWKFLLTTNFRRFMVLFTIAIIVLVPILNILFLLLQSAFMLIYLVSFIHYMRNVWCGCNKEDPWETMVFCHSLDGCLNLYVSVDISHSAVQSSFISFETVREKAMLYREKFQEVSATFPVMLYTKDFVYLYKWIMLVGFGTVAGLYVLSVVGVVLMTRLIGQARN